VEVIEANEMLINKNTLINKKTKLTDLQKIKLIDWFKK
jgi:hypothetical protein